MTPKIDIVTSSYLLGEAPHWDVATNALYLVDILGHKLIKYDPVTNVVSEVSTGDKQPSFIIPVEGRKNQFVIPMDKDLVLISWDGTSSKLAILENLGVADNTSTLKSNKFNDGKCDSSGRLWAGTIKLNLEDWSKSEPVGTLYSLNSNRELKGHVDQYRVSNGLAFNDQTKKFFHIDSAKGTIDRFDFDIITGTVKNRIVWFTLQKKNIPGVPDGMVIDADGNLWIAVFGARRVIKIDGAKPESLLDTVTLPAAQVTSVAFGGTNFDELYVTTGNVADAGRSTAEFPEGVTFRVTGIGAKGLPAPSFKLD